MPKKTRVSSVKKDVKRFHLLLSFSGIIYEGFGSSVIEALEEIKTKANKFLIKTWGVFTLVDGKKKAEIEMRPVQIRVLLFGGGFVKELFEKRILQRLK